jgi:hypothetical protein
MECPICLSLTQHNINTVTNCCKNKIHSNCLINWCIFKCEFNCPLCRSNEIYIPLIELLQFKSYDYILNKNIIKNLNTLINSYKDIPYIITINNSIDNQSNTSQISTLPLSLSLYRLPFTISIKFKQLFYLLLLFFILFYFIQSSQKLIYKI